MPVKVDRRNSLLAPRGELVPVAAFRSIVKGGTLAVAGIWLTRHPTA
jgi:hypothetical protein